MARTLRYGVIVQNVLQQLRGLMICVENTTYLQLITKLVV